MSRLPSLSRRRISQLLLGLMTLLLASTLVFCTSCPPATKQPATPSHGT